MATASKAPKRRSRMRDLFLFRRRPMLRGVAMDWEEPEAAAFQQALEWDGFISQKSWGEHDLAAHPVIVQDLRDLEQHLLPTFYQFTQRSKYFQNRYYLYQWVFIWGAFLTTLFGTLTTYSYNPFAAVTEFVSSDVLATVAQPDALVTPVIPEADTTTPQEAEAMIEASAQRSGGSYWSRIFGFLTALVGAATAFFTALSNRGEPQKRWAKNRRLAEELRMTYYKYLAHLPPFDQPDRVQQLRKLVIDARIKEQENVN